MTTQHLREAFFNKTQELLAIFDKDLNFIDANDALLISLHLKREQIIGKNISEISPDVKETGHYKTFLEVMKTGKSTVLDGIRMRSSLGNFVTRVNIFKLEDGIGLAAVNISDLKEAVNELETFIYKSSHDLRSPIASILGLINIASNDIQDIALTQTYLEKIKQQADRLDGVLRKLVEATRIQQSDKLIQQIDFTEFTEEVLNSLHCVKGFKEIKITTKISLKQKFYSDKNILVCLFQNMIDNAIKYRRADLPDSFLKISITDDDSGVKIVFADNGIGIVENLQKDIYKMFFRATNVASGSGLGLYTVKHCIKKLNGHISHESKDKVGTTFTVYIPSEKYVEEK